MTAPLTWREGDEIATGFDMAQQRSSSFKSLISGVQANRDYGPVT